MIWIQIHFPNSIVHPYNQHDILSEAIQIAGIENDQEYGLNDLPDLLDTHAENLKHSFGLVDNHANTTNDDTVNFQATEHLLKLHRGQVMREMIEAFVTD